jgi:DNA modification methylase
MSYLLLQASANALPLADASVQCVVTSPPYWGLRQYAGEQLTTWADGTEHALGLEPTPELYVQHMVEVFREVRRVLRADGTLWLNLGDSYAASQKGTGGGWAADPNNYAHKAQAYGSRKFDLGDLKPKDLVGIPWMVAFALRADGWYLRSDIIWHKPNPMPESVTDRPTKSHEYLFLLTKSERYFYDADAIKEAGAGRERFGNTGGKQGVNADRNDGGRRDMEIIESRNKRSVWTIATRPYPGAHFATFPEALVEPCILAGSAAQACGECGAPWERVTERPSAPDVAPSDLDRYGTGDAGVHRKVGQAYQNWLDANPKQTTGWRPTCAHDDDSGVCVILDPFNGSGTTGRVALRHGRSYVGTDISREYLDEQAIHRIDPIMAQHRDAIRTGLGQAALL